MQTNARTSKNHWIGHVIGEWQVIGEDPGTRNGWRWQHTVDAGREIGATVEQVKRMDVARRNRGR